MQKTFDEAVASLKIPFELAPLQVEDIKDLGRFTRVGMFWDTGVGKTVGATVLSAMWNADHTVVVMPHVLIDQWKVWLEEVDPGTSIGVYYGPKRKVEELEKKWVLTSHAIFRDNWDKFSPLARKNTTLLLDEAHYAKNVKSKLFQRVKNFCTSTNLALMTATPTTTPEDAYSYISLKTPDAYRSKTHFVAVHAGPADFFGRIESWRDIPKITHNLMLQSVKRTKEQVYGDRLVKPQLIPIHYGLDPAHYKLYTQLVDECIVQLESTGQKIDATTPQRLYHFTQQMIVNYSFFADNPKVRPEAFNLLDTTIDQTQCMNLENSKLLVWIWYKRSADTLATYIREKYGDVVCIANGDYDAQKAVKRFINDPNCRIMVGHPDSVGVGFNAMVVCSESLFIEFPTISMKARQALGRIDRMGQTRIPNQRFAIATGTIQERLFQNLLKSDDTVSQVELNPQSLRQILLGR